MFEKLTEKGDLIDERIDRFASLICDAARDALPESERAEFCLAHPAQPAQEAVLSVGRVCCDTIDENAKLNEKSVVLEASRELGAGCRVKMGLEDLLRLGQGYALFPGQIVGVDGPNPSGQTINASKIILPPLPPPVATPPSELLRLYPQEESASQRPINVLISAGPYTLEDSLNFEPLEEFVRDVVEKEAPDVVLLLGPFIDANHPLIASGDVDVDLDTLFVQQISARLERILRVRPNLKLILVPSIRDAVSEWCAFPQPPLASALDRDAAHARRRALAIPASVLLFPNPVQFTLNEIVFAVSTTDILHHLGAAEFARHPAVIRPDRMGRLFHHVLDQRSFYPLQPPALDDACLDLAHAGALELQAVPDVLILPSVLHRTVRKVEGCVCINPGLLVKGQVGGTFAKLCIHPLDMERVKSLVGAGKKGQGDDMDVDGVEKDIDGVEEEGVRHEVAERCRVEIQRV
ncbi:DNA-directed DNA polymerase alpha subunit pol12 [Borealophlyctis nickersoniae]|nr:DNA-directed DNA polymerase alpha subunit pol12 [Borealophlyctis nickersoniae]